MTANVLIILANLESVGLYILLREVSTRYGGSETGLGYVAGLQTVVFATVALGSVLLSGRESKFDFRRLAQSATALSILGLCAALVAAAPSLIGNTIAR